MSSKSTPPSQPAPETAKKPSVRFRMDIMPPSYQAVGKIIQILTALSLPDAEQALSVVNQMFGGRKQLAEQPPHLAE